MKTKVGAIFASLFFAASVAMAEDGKSSSGGSDGIMTGDAAKACNMMLCLSDPSGKGLPECKKPLDDYYDMKPKKRPKFLKKCPMVK